MSRSKATKRRKVWVIWDKHGPCASYHRRDLAKQRLVRLPSLRRLETVVPMVERLPGDVVLSREDVAELRELVQANLSATRPSGTDGRILALLRGGR